MGLKIQDERNRIVGKNIVWTGAFKILGLLSSLLIVPITIDYLNPEIYGIWMTITSILFMFTFFDIGLGNGMRNYLTQSISEGDWDKGKAYLSTTLGIIATIAFILGIIATVLLSCLDLSHIFNSTAISNQDLQHCMFIAIFFTLINFIIKNIGYVFVALQRYALNELLTVMGSVTGLIIIYILTKTTEGNLMYVTVALTATPVVIYFFAAIPIFRKYPQLTPSIRKIDASLMKQVTYKGLGFFFIQITSCLVLFTGANILISHFCGPKSVTTYNIAYKYFNLIAIAYTIVLSPLWNAYTDAYVKKNMTWIKSTFRRAIAMWGLSILMGVILLCVCTWFYKIWIGTQINVPLSVSIAVLAYISFFNFNNCTTYLLNGLNKIRVQMITSAIFTAIYLLVVITLGHNLRLEGIVWSIALIYAIMGGIHLYQCHLLINDRAIGIWNK